jgi:hypothetical protein
VGRQFHRRWFVLKRSIFVEQLIDPDRESEVSAIELMLFKCCCGRACVVKVAVILLRLAFIEQGIDFCAQSLSSSSCVQPISRAMISSRSGSSR